MPYGFNEDKSKYDIGDMFHLQRVNATVSNGNQNVIVEAPSVDGYQFLCWFMAATINWIGPQPYTPTPENQRCTFWVSRVYVTSNNQVAYLSGNREIACFAMYVKE